MECLANHTDLLKENTDFLCKGCNVMFVKLLVCALLSVAWAKERINTDVIIWRVVMASLCLA